MPRLPLIVLTAPLVLSAGFMLTVAVAEVAGRSPFAEWMPRNSAEAAALGDPAAMLRFLRYGDNPTRDYPVRPHIISPDIVHATTLEAALWTRRVDMIRLLDRLGAIVDADQRRHLACLAADLDLPEVRAYLAPAHGCARGEALARLVARSRQSAGENNE